MDEHYRWWKARVIFPDGEMLDIIPAFTAQPAVYRHGLERTYITATVLFWEVDANGNPIGGKEPEAAQAAAAKKADGAVRIKADADQKERARRPPGMAEWPNT